MSRKFNKRLFIILAVLLMLLLLIFLANILISSRIESELRQLTQKEIIPGMNLSFGEVSSSILNKSIEIEDILLTTDTTNPKQISFVKIRSLSLSGIKFRKILKENKIDLSEIVIMNPEIALNEELKLPEANKHNNTTSGDSVKMFGLFNVDTFRCSGLDMITHINGDKVKEINNVDIQINKLVVNSENKDKENIHFENAFFSTGHFEMITSDRLYKLGFDKLIFGNRSSDIEVEGIKIKPQYDPYRFARMLPFQTDRFDISLPELIIKGFDLTTFLTDRKILCREISIQNPVFDIFRDKNIPRDTSFYPPMPQEALRKIPFPVKVDTILLNNSSIKYTEHEKNALSAGYVFFKPANFLITSINNNPDFFNNMDQFNLYMTASLMGKSTARAKVNFFLDDSSKVSFSGTLEPMDADIFNTITVPNAGIRINTGLIEKVYFEFFGTLTKSRGEVEFFYKDLDFTLLKQKEGVHKDRKFISFIAGKMLRTSNSADDRRVFLAEVKFNRDMNKGVINYIWKSVLEGVKATVTPGKKNLTRIE